MYSWALKKISRLNVIEYAVEQGKDVPIAKKETNITKYVVKCYFKCLI